MRHYDIERFEIAGTIGDDKDLIRLRGEFERLLVQDMRDAGYVPHLDLAPVFTTEYNGQYEFKLSMYGVKENAGEVEGVDGRSVYRRSSSSSSS